MKLTPTQRDELLIELKTVIVGMEGTDERGMAGDIKEIKNQVRKQNGKIFKNRASIIGLTCFLVGVGVLEWSDIIHIFGG